MALGSVIWFTESMTCQASRRWRTATTSRLYSSASSRAWSVTCSSTVLDLDPQGRAGTGDAAADAGALLGLEHGGRGSPAEPADALDGGDDAVRRVAVLEPRGDQQPAVAAGAGGVDGGLGGLVERDRHDHPGQHDEVGDEEDGEPSGHGSHLSRLERYRLNSRPGPAVPPFSQGEHPWSRSRAPLVRCPSAQREGLEPLPGWSRSRAPSRGVSRPLCDAQPTSQLNQRGRPTPPGGAGRAGGSAARR